MAKSFLSVLSRAVSAPQTSIIDWVGRSLSGGAGGIWAQTVGSTSATGKTITVNKAMRLAACWSCVRLISETIATLPLGLYMRQADGGRKVASDDDLHWIINTNPNSRMTAVQFWEAVVASMLLRGNAFVEIVRIGGRIVALEFLLPNRMDLDVADNGEILYRYREKNGQLRDIAGSDMMHIPAFSLDGQIGLSPIAYGADVFGAAMSAEDVAGSTFKNGMHQTVAFEVNKTLSPKQRDDFRDYVQRISGAMNAGKSPVLEEGVSAKVIGINPVDAQLLESREYSAEEICRFYMVDPTMVGYSDKASNWGTGLEQKLLRFLTFTLRSYMRRIEEGINRNLLTPAQRRQIYSEFSIEGLLRADSAARATLYSGMVQNGIYTRDECRMKENLPKMGGNAGVLTVQTNLSPIDKLGQGDDGQAARAALQNWLDQPANSKE
ncbi:Portal protein, phage associated [Pseudomonas caricapapayae]|uniref:Portal protein, phage associated n=1 Tax=Pseudomonas caricapapayae TaxID=46678 RepID=A0A0P9KM27_9PSED|nr:phage portal protein [Pseudomonas caricapapayae]KPW57099.1 Portal protein, phage associated [Pseudomonas caricapapayae]RMM11411.1 Portal protein, phage associated [Pseudomonas caricapapayae]RMV91542.1 Portal protein, phage associated [Pseudomonas caricapapayae]